MGISGLLPLLKDIHANKHLSDYAGQTLGVDAYVWLHRGSYGCADAIVQGLPTTKYVDYAMYYVRMLKYHGITPYVVFDGGPLPSKAGTEEERRLKREANTARANSLLKEGKVKQARELATKSIDITPEMAYQLIKALKHEKVQYIVAPYEADAQLAFLCQEGLIDGVITEDSDLLIFGCKKVILKLDKNGDCVEIQQDQIGSNRSVSFAGWSIAEFRQMAILSGCDYLPSIVGMGLKNAHTLLRRHKSVDKVLQCIRFEGKLSVPSTYAIDFRRAELTFLHQRVFDPRGEDGGRAKTLNPLPDGVDGESPDFLFIGPPLSDEVARGIASGDLDPISRQAMADIAPGFQPSAATSTRGRSTSSTKPASFAKPSKPAPAVLPKNQTSIRDFFGKKTNSTKRVRVAAQEDVELKQLRPNVALASLEEAAPVLRSPSRKKARMIKNLRDTASTSRFFPTPSLLQKTDAEALAKTASVASFGFSAGLRRRDSPHASLSGSVSPSSDKSLPLERRDDSGFFDAGFIRSKEVLGTSNDAQGLHGDHLSDCEQKTPGSDAALTDDVPSSPSRALEELGADRGDRSEEHADLFKLETQSVDGDFLDVAEDDRAAGVQSSQEDVMSSPYSSPTLTIKNEVQQSALPMQTPMMRRNADRLISTPSISNSIAASAGASMKRGNFARFAFTKSMLTPTAATVARGEPVHALQASSSSHNEPPSSDPIEADDDFPMRPQGPHVPMTPRNMMDFSALTSAAAEAPQTMPAGDVSVDAVSRSLRERFGFRRSGSEGGGLGAGQRSAATLTPVTKPRTGTATGSGFKFERFNSSSSTRVSLSHAQVTPCPRPSTASEAKKRVLVVMDATCERTLTPKDPLASFRFRPS